MSLSNKKRSIYQFLFLRIMSNERGFGAGAVIVIVALILIIGGYMYYSSKKAGTETATSTADVTLPGADNLATPVGTDGLPGDTGTTTASTTASTSTTATTGTTTAK